MLATDISKQLWFDPLPAFFLCDLLQYTSQEKMRSCHPGLHHQHGYMWALVARTSAVIYKLGYQLPVSWGLPMPHLLAHCSRSLRGSVNSAGCPLHPCPPLLPAVTFVSIIISAWRCCCPWSMLQIWIILGLPWCHAKPVIHTRLTT